MTGGGGEALDKLKASVTECVHIDPDILERAQIRMQQSLYGKFFGRPPKFEIVKRMLADLWRDLGSYRISDMPNGYFLIRCETSDTYQHLLYGGPWTVAGLVLWLFPWRPNFQPAFERMETATIWLQFHHLPLEMRELEFLETIASQFGRVLKLDDNTETISRGRCARVCVEVDLSQPIKRGVWIGDAAEKIFVVVLYEQLPVFCYKYGLVGHGEGNCSTNA